MNRGFILICLLALICFDLIAQRGNFFLSNHSPTDERIDFRSHDMIQDLHGEIYFANRAGVLEYDGLNWKSLSVPGAVFTLVTDGKEVFVGGLTGIGILKEKIDSPRTYELFSDVSGVFSSVYNSQHAFFCSEDKIIIYSLASQKVATILEKNSDTGNFLGVFNLGENIVVTTAGNKLYAIKNNELVTSNFEISNLLFTSSSPTNQAVLIGTKGNRIYILKNNQLREVFLEQSDFLVSNILTDGVWVSESRLALGTQRGGVIFVNPSTGATEEIVDYAAGLPDNEVFSLMRDKNEGVWVAHEYGFTRIATNIPFRAFHNYPGLIGNLLCVRPFQDRLYVGTTMGLFVLTQSNSGSPELSTEGFEYKRVNAIQGKVNQLDEIDGSLIAYGASGVYEITDQTARSIIPEPVRHVFSSSALNQVLISTMDNQIKSFIPSKEGWKETHLFDTLKNHFSYVFEDRLDNVWLCGSTMIYKVEAVDNEVIEVLQYPIQNPTNDETLGLALGSEVYVVSSGQFEHYSGSGFEKYDSLSGGHRYFASAGNFWFNDGEKWRTVDRKLQSMRLEWLGIFPDLRFLATDNKHNSLWAITDANELYKFNNDQAESNESLYPLFLREVRGSEIELTSEVEVDQVEGAFSFEFIRADYIGTHANFYRYLVKGLNMKWSQWSTSNNVINFSYLPPGRYQLVVQSKNALGDVSEIEEVPFLVKPPYWKRWWFYALEFAVFSILVSLSVQLGRSNTRYRFLSQILTILTVIMLIEFIQSIITSFIISQSSPVIDFFIQVIIALLVFPVEIVARKTIRRIVQDKYAVQRLFNDPKESDRIKEA